MQTTTEHPPGWCDGSQHEPWHVFEAEPAQASGLYRVVARSELAARVKIGAAFPATRRLRLYVQDAGPVRCWRYANEPDPHAIHGPEHHSERTGRVDR